MTETATYFEIEAYKDVKKTTLKGNKIILVYVKWENYPSSSNTWEPTHNLPAKPSISMMMALKETKAMKKKQKLIDEAIEVFKERAANESYSEEESSEEEVEEDNRNEVEETVNFAQEVDEEPNNNTKTDNGRFPDEEISVTNFGTVERNESKDKLEKEMQQETQSKVPNSLNKKQAPTDKQRQNTPKNSVTNISNSKALSGSKVLDRSPINVGRSSNKIDKPSKGSLDIPWRYTDLFFNQEGLTVNKLRLDASGKIIANQQVLLSSELTLTDNPKDLARLLCAKLHQAHEIIRLFQEKAKEHNEKLSKNN